MATRTIKWTKQALKEFERSVKYIKRQSVQNAEMVRRVILEKVQELESDIIQHRQDPYKKNNNGSVLYFEILKHRIVYRNSSNKVTILRVRHTKQEPKPY